MAGLCFEEAFQSRWKHLIDERIRGGDSLGQESPMSIGCLAHRRLSSCKEFDDILVMIPVGNI